MEYLKQSGWFLIMLIVFTGLVKGDTDEPPTTTPVVANELLKMPPVHYNFAFQTENGQTRDEEVDLDEKSVPPKMDLSFKGSYSFISADGYEYQVFYKADKRGYRPFVTAHKIKTEKDNINK